jgi:hypothetical protein
MPAMQPDALPILRTIAAKCQLLLSIEASVAVDAALSIVIGT